MRTHDSASLPRPVPCLFPWLLLPALLAGWASPAHAQQPRPATEERILEIGPRIGYDYRENVAVLGAHLRLPIDPWHRLEFVPSGDLTFRSGFTERQLNLDGTLYVDGSRSLYIGAGWAFRNTFYLDENRQPLDERETRSGYTLFGGLHAAATVGIFVPQIEARWTFVDVFEPKTISLGLNYPIPLGF